MADFVTFEEIADSQMEKKVQKLNGANFTSEKKKQPVAKNTGQRDF